jgi:hypothetical protein
MCMDGLSCPSTLRPGETDGPRSFASIFLARRAVFLARSAIFPLPLIVHAQPLNGPTEKVLRQDLTPRKCQI